MLDTYHSIPESNSDDTRCDSVPVHEDDDNKQQKPIAVRRSERLRKKAEMKK